MASAPPDGHDEPTVRALREETRRLRRRVSRLDRVIERLQRTEVWDYSVYEQTPGPEWVAVNRRDLEDLYVAAAEAAEWQPWQRIIERRPG